MEITQPNTTDPDTLVIDHNGCGTLHTGYGRRMPTGGTFCLLGPKLTERFRAAYEAGQNRPENAPVAWNAKRGYIELA